MAEPISTAAFTAAAVAAASEGGKRIGSRVTDAVGLGQGDEQKRYMDKAYPGTLPHERLGGSTGGRPEAGSGRDGAAIFMQKRELQNRKEVADIQGMYAERVANIQAEPPSRSVEVAKDRLEFDKYKFQREIEVQFPKVRAETKRLMQDTAVLVQRAENMFREGQILTEKGIQAGANTHILQVKAAFAKL